MPGNDEYTVSLLHCDGDDESAVITDDAENGTHTWTARGTAQIDTAQSKFGGASLLLDGDSDWVDTPDSDDWNFGSGAFTIDFWVRFNALPAASGLQVLINQWVDATHQWNIYLYNNAGTYEWRWHMDNAATTIYVNKASPGLNTGTWYHIACVRTGDIFRVFQDGTQCGTDVTDSDSFPDLGGLLYIGKFGTNPTPYYFNGWLDEIRISKGIARWTSGFTPPTEAYSDTILYEYSAVGGSVVAGLPSIALTKSLTATGGGLSAGSPAMAVTVSPSIGGGGVIAGEPVIQRVVDFNPAGGVVVAGEGTFSKGIMHVSTGGATVAGEPDFLRIVDFSGSGGSVVAGTFPVLKLRNFLASGGCVFGGRVLKEWVSIIAGRAVYFFSQDLIGDIRPSTNVTRGLRSSFDGDMIMDSGLTNLSSTDDDANAFIQDKM